MRAKQRLIGVLVLLLLGAGRTAWLWLNPPPVTSEIHQTGYRVVVEGPLTHYGGNGLAGYGVVTGKQGTRVAIRHLEGRPGANQARVFAVGRLEFDPRFGHYLKRAAICPEGKGLMWRTRCDAREVLSLI